MKEEEKYRKMKEKAKLKKVAKSIGADYGDVIRKLASE